MTPSQLAFHEAHKARMARFAAAANRHVENKLAAAAFAAVFNEPQAGTESDVEAKQSDGPSMRYWFQMVGLSTPTIKDIQRAVCDFYGVSLNDLVSARRTKLVTLYRQYAMYLAKEITRQSLPRIGRQFGGRDHTTVHHAVNKVTRLLELNEELNEEFETIRKMLEGCDATAPEDCHDAKGAFSHKTPIPAACRAAARSGFAHGQAASPREPGGSA